MNKKGFTLIELIAVVVILGIIILIAVPAVTSYIRGSDDAVYANSIYSYVQEVKMLYSEKQIGPYINKNEIMVVPLSSITMQKGNLDSSPYAKIEQEQSYIVVERTANSVKYYATVIDKVGRGMVDKSEDNISNSAIQKDLKSVDAQLLDASYTCQTKIVNGSSKKVPNLISTAIFRFNNNNYKPVEYRIYPEEDYDCDSKYPVIIYEKI